MRYEQQPTLVLIHGAWQGSWAWERFVPLAEAAGCRVLALDLPGNGSDNTPPDVANIDSYAGHVGMVLADIEGPVVLVGHSGAGVIATEVAERWPDQICCLVYVAGMMLPPKMTFSDVVAQLQSSIDEELAGIEPYLVWSDSGQISEVPAEAGVAIFLNDVPEQVALSAAKKLRPQATPGLALASNWTPERCGRLPRLYIECLQDKSVKLVVQRHMQHLVPGATVITLDSGHAPQVSMPDVLLEAILSNLPTAA